MSWQACLYGTLTLSTADEVRWRSLEASPGEWHDWPKEFYVDGHETVKVGQVLDEVKDLAADAWLRLERGTDGKVHITGILHEDAYNDYATALATAFRLTSRVGGVGQLCMADCAFVDFVWRINVENGDSSITNIPQEERAALEASASEAIAAAGIRRDSPRD